MEFPNTTATVYRTDSSVYDAQIEFVYNIGDAIRGSGKSERLGRAS